MICERRVQLDYESNFLLKGTSNGGESFEGLLLDVTREMPSVDSLDLLFYR